MIANEPLVRDATAKGSLSPKGRPAGPRAKRSGAYAKLLRSLARAETSSIRQLKKLTQTLATHRTALLEVINNKVETLQHHAYGYRDIEYCKLKIMALHQTKYILAG